MEINTSNLSSILQAENLVVVRKIRVPKAVQIDRHPMIKTSNSLPFFYSPHGHTVIDPVELKIYRIERAPHGILSEINSSDDLFASFSTPWDVLGAFYELGYKFRKKVTRENQQQALFDDIYSRVHENKGNPLGLGGTYNG